MPAPNQQKKKTSSGASKSRPASGTLNNRMGLDEGTMYMHPASRLGDLAREAPLGNLAQAAIEKRRKQRLGLFNQMGPGAGNGARSRMMGVGADLVDEGGLL
jgi:hypothetical protein